MPTANNAKPSFANPSSSNNKNAKPQQNQAAAQSQNTGLLIDFGDAVKAENNSVNVKQNDNGLFSQLQFDNVSGNNNNNNQQQQHFNQETYNHNQQIFNNLNIDFGEDSDEENYGNANNNNNIHNNFNPLENNNNVYLNLFCYFLI